MKKIYEIKVAKISFDWGKFEGYETIGFAEKENVNKKIEEFKKKHQVNQYWVTYETDINEDIKFYINEIKVD